MVTNSCFHFDMDGTEHREADLRVCDILINQAHQSPQLDIVTCLLIKVSRSGSQLLDLGVACTMLITTLQHGQQK